MRLLWSWYLSLEHLKNNPLFHILEQERVNRNKFIERSHYYLGIIICLRFSSVEMSWPGVMYQNFGLMHLKNPWACASCKEGKDQCKPVISEAVGSAERDRKGRRLIADYTVYTIILSWVSWWDLGSNINIYAWKTYSFELWQLFGILQWCTHHTSLLPDHGLCWKYVCYSL